MTLLMLLACGPDPIPTPADGWRSGGRDNLIGPEGQTVFTYARSVVIDTPGRDSPRLFLLEGQKTETGYHATRLGTGVLHSGLFDSWWTLEAACTGEMIDADGVVTFTTGGSPVCEAFAGVHTNEPVSKPAAAAPLPDTACGAYTQCVCDLSMNWTLSGPSGMANPFSDACSGARGLLSQGKDDPSTCEGGRAIFSGMASEIGLAVPASCTKAP